MPFLIKKRNIGKYTAELIILWYDNFGVNNRPLQRNGMAAIPKINILVTFVSCRFKKLAI